MKLKSLILKLNGAKNWPWLRMHQFWWLQIHISFKESSDLDHDFCDWHCICIFVPKITTYIMAGFFSRIFLHTNSSNKDESISPVRSEVPKLAPLAKNRSPNFFWGHKGSTQIISSLCRYEPKRRKLANYAVWIFARKMSKYNWYIFNVFGL